MITINCSCEKKQHQAPDIEFISFSKALTKLPDLLKKYKRVFIVADENTYEAAGKSTEIILKNSNILFNTLILKGEVLPDAKTIGTILIHINNTKAKSDIFAFSPLPDFILAIGSGTINDCCRLVSYRLGITYGVVGTAPSMDGYFSAGSPILFDNSKATIQCSTPKLVLADLDIMGNAPYEMLMAGIGDMLGKYTGILDWQLSNTFNGEYYCEKIAGDVLLATDNCLNNAHLILNRNHRGIDILMKGFMVTGLGMAFIGNSRPASGSEHIIAHAWELQEIYSGDSLTLHGLLVLQAARLVCSIFRILMFESDDKALVNLISQFIHRFDAIESFCNKNNFINPITDKNKILKGVYDALDLRDRYTVLYYLKQRNMLDEYIKRAADDIS